MGTDRRGHALDHDRRDLLGRQRRGQGRCEFLKPLDLQPRSFRVLRRVGRSAVPASHDEAHCRDRDTDDERHHPADDVVARSDREGRTGWAQHQCREGPAGDHRSDSTDPTTCPDAKSDSPDERRIRDLRVHGEESGRHEDAAEAEHGSGGNTSENATGSGTQLLGERRLDLVHHHIHRIYHYLPRDNRSGLAARARYRSASSPTRFGRL